MTYELDILTLSKKDTELIEKFQRKSVKQIQALPDKTMNVATLGLLGTMLIETIVHKNALNLFMYIIIDKQSNEYQIAER